MTEVWLAIMFCLLCWFTAFGWPLLWLVWAGIGLAAFMAVVDK